MPTNYPTSIDSFVDPTATDTMNTPGVYHDVQHSDLNDSVSALETTLGISGSYNFIQPENLPALTPAAAVAVANESLTGNPVIDGYTLAAGDIVLLTAQTTASQNGPWLIPAGGGAWTRPPEFPSGALVHGRVQAIINGTAYANSLWLLNAPTAGITIDTTAQTWKEASSAGGGSVQTIASPAGTISITNPTGPTVDIDLSGVIGGQTYTASWTFTTADLGAESDYNVATTAGTGTIPLGLTPTIGATLTGRQLGTGPLTIAGATGVTINGTSAGKFTLSGIYQTFLARQVATDVWAVTGSGVSSGGGGGSFSLKGLVPPALSNNTDYTLDGTWNGTISSGSIGFSNGNGNPTRFFSLSGTTYTNPNIIFLGRNITINSGIELTGGAIILVASESITLSGTISVPGINASGATGGVQSNWGWTGSNGTNWTGANGQNGGTGNGLGGIGNDNNHGVIGGSGGAGGNSGSNTGGGAALNNNQFTGGWAGGGFSLRNEEFLFLLCHYNNSVPVPIGIAQGMLPPVAGCGGASGAGDGTNAGGGGGGGGGGIILISPQITVTSTATLSAVGGAGAAGVAGNAGGGGGGGGGFIALHGGTITIQAGATFDLAGGAGGAGVGTGTAGTAGAASNMFADPPVTDGGFGYGVGPLICQWG